MTAIAAISPVAFSSFGDLLRFLRRRARLQQRDLAIAVGYSESQICRLEQNQRLPDLTTLAALFVPALDLEDKPELATKLLELAAAARSEKGDGGATNPQPTASLATIAHTSAPANAARQYPPSNLPTPLTPLIDRTSEVAAALGLLARGDVRMLTLVGPPGIGKTRLGLRVAAEYAAQQEVLFVPLAAVRDPAVVLPTIAHTLGIKERADLSLLEALRAVLCDRRLLLILDNFEQVLPAATDVAELLRAAPDLKVLVTSRAALHLSGEHLLVIPPLALPDLRALPPIEDLVRYPAIELFLMRVQAVNPEFILKQEHARTVAEICVGLDGLPLAIELAAARSRLFTPQALLDRLRCAAGPTALQFLVDGPRDLLTHQQTLRSTLDWSYELLGEHERHLLMHLSLFAGGGAADAIGAVVTWNVRTFEHSELLSASTFDTETEGCSKVLDGLLALVDQSLVRYEAASGAEPRFSMLETVREYAREKLEAAGLAEHARRRYVGYYLGLAYTAERELNGARQERWFRRLEQEYDNLQVVLAWLAERNPTDGLRLATSLRQFWPMRGYLNEGRRWLEALLRDDRAIGIEAGVRAHALCVAGYLAYHQGDLLRAQALSQASLALSRPLGERRCTVDALLNLGGVAYYQNDYARASEIYTECLMLYRQLDAPAEQALVLKNLGLVAKDQGNFPRAKAFFEESLAIRRALDDKRGAAQALFCLSLVAYWLGDYARAAELSEQCVASYGELGDQMGAAYALDNVGMAAYKQADLAWAADRIAASLQALRELGDQAGVAMALTDLGTVVRAQGDRARAAQLHAEALAIAWRMGDKRRLAFCIEGLAFALEPARFAEAARLLGAAEALREAIGAPLPQAELADYQCGVAAARADCGEAAVFEQAWAVGRELALEQIVGQFMLCNAHFKA